MYFSFFKLIVSIKFNARSILSIIGRKSIIIFSKENFIDFSISLLNLLCINTISFSTISSFSIIFSSDSFSCISKN
ncbi:hypothetical protein CWO_01315 [Buchnera aphidicola str. LL01 (Acyrthosiphon pisum)]|nr:hypothetical protein CWO_01315 [Buchnera aphidicola str. LL01 (Acyrthosiphon pisum)]